MSAAGRDRINTQVVVLAERTQRECVQLPALFRGQSSSVRLAIEAAAGAQRVAQGILEVLGCGRHVAGWRSCSAEPREQGRHQLRGRERAYTRLRVQ